MMQYLLYRLWERRREGWLTNDAYDIAASSYLASEATRYTTGQVFVIDGGYTLF